MQCASILCLDVLFFGCLIRSLGRVRLEQALELGGVGADKVVDLLAVLEEEEGGDGADTELLGDFGNVIDVKLNKVHLILKFFRIRVPDEDELSVLHARGWSNWRSYMRAYFSRMGAMALQGGHQSA